MERKGGDKQRKEKRKKSRKESIILVRSREVKKHPGNNRMDEKGRINGD
jgi:hypothetical protein